MVPIHPADQDLLGLQWKGITYTDQTLPFGICLSLKILNALAWDMVNQIHIVLNYLDWLLFQLSSRAIILPKVWTSQLHLLTTWAPNDTKQLALLPVLVFLAIEIDVFKWELWLPLPKLVCLKRTIQQWLNKWSATKHQLHVLLGHLKHAAVMTPTGCPIDSFKFSTHL